jgi:hypothetical protein
MVDVLVFVDLDEVLEEDLVVVNEVIVVAGLLPVSQCFHQVLEISLHHKPPQQSESAVHAAKAALHGVFAGLEDELLVDVLVLVDLDEELNELVVVTECGELPADQQTNGKSN